MPRKEKKVILEEAEFYDFLDDQIGDLIAEDKSKRISPITESILFGDEDFDFEKATTSVPSVSKVIEPGVTTQKKHKQVRLSGKVSEPDITPSSNAEDIKNRIQKSHRESIISVVGKRRDKVGAVRRNIHIIKQDKENEKGWMIARERGKWLDNTNSDLKRPFEPHPQRWFANSHDIRLLTLIKGGFAFIECDYWFKLPRGFHYRTAKGKKRTPEQIITTYMRNIDGSYSTRLDEENNIVHLSWRAKRNLNQFVSNDGVIQWFYKNMNEISEAVRKFNKKVATFQKNKNKKKGQEQQDNQL